MNNKIYKILVVDDQYENIFFISNIFKEYKKNYTIIHALSGETAWDIILKEIPDLILSDWDMPEKDGLELLLQLKSESRTKNIPFIMFTGRMMDGKFLEQALQAGANDFLRKPIETVELLARVGAVLKLYDLINQDRIQQKNDLALYSTIFLKYKQFLSKTEDKVSKILSFANKNNIKELSNQLLKEIESFKNETSFNRFSHYYNEKFPGFEQRLVNQFPMLNSTELTICLLLKAGMSSKEIAETMLMQSGSIKTARYRLRRKFNLKGNESLSYFLNKI